MVVLVCALALAVVLGLVLRWRNGRFTSPNPAPRASADDAAIPASAAAPTSPLTEFARGERATLLQFSSAFCAPCRATRRTLTEVSDAVPGVAHVEIDAESHLELVRRLNILRTPTTIVLDAKGTEVARASGAPTKPQVIQALGNAIS